MLCSPAREVDGGPSMQDPRPDSTIEYGPRLQDWYDSMRHELMLDREPEREYDVVDDGGPDHE